jgi:hypothetical protein
MSSSSPDCIGDERVSGCIDVPAPAGPKRILGAVVAAFALFGCTAMSQTSPPPADARLQVMAAERAFAKTAQPGLRLRVRELKKGLAP